MSYVQGKIVIFVRQPISRKEDSRMRTKLKLLAMLLMTLVFAASLVGCASTHGNKKIAEEDVINKIVPGKSTKKDVRNLIGDPIDVQFTDNGEEVWKYHYTRSDVRGTSFIPYAGALIGGTDTKTTTLTIRFDKNGVVKNVGKGGSTGGGGGLQDLSN